MTSISAMEHDETMSIFPVFITLSTTRDGSSTFSMVLVLQAVDGRSVG